MADAATDRPEIGTGLDGIPRSGETIGGKFIVERVLGIGGMGVVVAARHIQLGQSVAIKFLRRSAATSPESVNRFLREARASVGLQSAHVVRVMDVGTLEDGLPYMVMEYLDGSDLGQSLELRGTLPIEEAVDCLVQAMDAVAEAHSIGIVHRDLKPSNLFLTIRADGSALVKVLDFGISKAVDGMGPPVNLTATSMVLGSPLYMSPEQVRSTKNVDTRTDVWALGVILYELVAGLPPFEAETVTGLCAKIVADPPVPLRSRRPEIPAAFEAVVNRCLDKDVTRRYRTVADLGTALRQFASTEGRMAIDRIVRMSGSRPAVPTLKDTAGSAGSGPVDGPLEVSAGYAETVASWQTTGVRRNRRIATGVSLAVGLLVFALGAVFVLKGRHTVPAGTTAIAADMSMTPLSAPPALATAKAALAAGPTALAPLPSSVAPPPELLPPAVESAAPPTPAPAASASGTASALAVASSPVALARTAHAPIAAPPHPATPKAQTPAPPAQANGSSDDLLLDRK